MGVGQTPLHTENWGGLPEDVTVGTSMEGKAKGTAVGGRGPQDEMVRASF